ncbi:MAG: sugar phosphate isomerase/epimerase family protein [Asgard group archaeon]|nr:sugar phosphate isomerase/epimerase family protein [Asgard group archaeon]
MKFGASLIITFEEISSVEEFLAKIAKIDDIEIIELVLEPPYLSVASLNEEKIAIIRNYLKDKGLQVTIHAPFSDLNISSLNDNVRNFAIQEIIKSIDVASKFHSKIVTIHPGSLGAYGKSFEEEIAQKNFQSIKKLTEYAAGKNIILCLENMPVTPWLQLEDTYNPNKIKAIIKKIDNPYLQITWDIGHSNTTSFTLEEHFIAFKDSIKHVHLHDNLGTINGWRDTHLKIGEGTINWETIFQLLTEINYDKGLILELKSFKEIQQSLEKTKKWIK